MRLSDAGARRPTKAVYPDHRPSPWPNEDDASRSLEPIVRRHCRLPPVKDSTCYVHRAVLLPASFHPPSMISTLSGGITSRPAPGILLRRRGRCAVRRAVIAGCMSVPYQPELLVRKRALGLLVPVHQAPRGSHGVNRNEQAQGSFPDKQFRLIGH